MYGVRKGGLGTIDASGNVTYPWYCNMPGVDALFSPADCAVPTQAQLDAVAAASIQKAAGAGTPAYNPDLAAQQTAAYQQDAAALCSSDPVNCAAYKAANAPATNWMLYGVLAIVGVVGLVAMGGGSPRRYGR